MIPASTREWHSHTYSPKLPYPRASRRTDFLPPKVHSDPASKRSHPNGARSTTSSKFQQMEPLLSPSVVIGRLMEMVKSRLLSLSLRIILSRAISKRIESNVALRPGIAN